MLFIDTSERERILSIPLTPFRVFIFYTYFLTCSYNVLNAIKEFSKKCEQKSNNSI